MLPALTFRTLLQSAGWLLGLAFLISLLIGLLTLRQANEIKYFRVRHTRLVRGWFWVALSMVWLGMGLGIFRYEDRIHTYFFPPTPTLRPSPTLSPQPTSTLTPYLSPTPTFSPTPSLPKVVEIQMTGQSTPPVRAKVSDLVFAMEMDKQGKPIKAGVSFKNPLKELYVLFRYGGFIKGMQVSVLWWRNGELVNYDTVAWQGEEEGFAYFQWKPEDSETWQPGAYEVQLFVGSEWKMSGQFTVEGAPPTHTPTGTLSPTATATFTVTLTSTSTRTPTPSSTPRPTRTEKPTYTPFPTKTLTTTWTPRPTITSTLTPTLKPTSTRQPSNTPRPTYTLPPTITPWHTITFTPTWTPRPTHTSTLTATLQPTVTRQPSNTPRPTYTLPPTITPWPTITQTPTWTPRPTRTNTPTPTNTFTAFPSLTPSRTSTPTALPVRTSLYDITTATAEALSISIGGTAAVTESPTTDQRLSTAEISTATRTPLRRFTPTARPQLLPWIPYDAHGSGGLQSRLTQTAEALKTAGKFVPDVPVLPWLATRTPVLDQQEENQFNSISEVGSTATAAATQTPTATLTPTRTPTPTPTLTSTKRLQIIPPTTTSTPGLLPWSWSTPQPPFR